ncbi:hypothetical protein CYMTET_14780, partial [Cymbomonas tetramitiformis]
DSEEATPVGLVVGIAIAVFIGSLLLFGLIYYAIRTYWLDTSFAGEAAPESGGEYSMIHAPGGVEFKAAINNPTHLATVAIQEEEREAALQQQQQQQQQYRSNSNTAAAAAALQQHKHLR